MTDDDCWEPTRQLPTHRREGVPFALTPAQRRLADELHIRAAALRLASDGALSISEAVDLAAAQLGLEGPQTRTDLSEDA